MVSNKSCVLRKWVLIVELETDLVIEVKIGLLCSSLLVGVVIVMPL